MKILNKLTNTKTVLAIVSLIVLILVTVGVEVDSEKINTVAKALCGILVLLGIMNDAGMESSEWNK